MNALIRILLVDDHPIVRDGLRRVEQLEPTIQIVGEAGSVHAAVDAAHKLKPNVILMDIRLPDGDGIEACRRIKTVLPDTKILFLTSFGDNQLLLAAMEAGADGYLLKENDAQKLVAAIQSVMAGQTVFDPIPGNEHNRLSGHDPTKNAFQSLSPQERRVLEEVARGKTDKEVAVALGLTTKTARNYLDRIFSKLKVHTRTEAALLFTRLRL